MKNLLGLFAAAVCAVALTGCSGSSIDNGPRIAFANALRIDAEMVGKVDGRTETGTLARGAVSDDKQYDNGYRRIEVQSATGTTFAERTDFLFEEKTNYLAIGYNSQAGGGAEESVDLKFVTENEVTEPGKARIHFARATDYFGDVDVYVVPQGGTLEQGVLFPLNTTGEDNTTVAFAPGTYDLRVFARGTTDNRLNGTQEFVVEGSKNYLFIFTAEGDLADAQVDWIQYLER